MSLLPFLIAALVLAITPGPGIAYVVARTLSGGRKEGLASCVGTGMGGLVHVIASALGISLVIAQSATAFAFVKFIGAAYLFFLGFRMLFKRSDAPAIEASSAHGPRRAFVEGMTVEALNVKTALFFLAFLPQFADPHVALMPQIVMLGCICVAFNTLADMVAVLAADRFLVASTKRSQSEKFMTKASGLTMIALGTYLALAERR